MPSPGASCSAFSCMAASQSSSCASTPASTFSSSRALKNGLTGAACAPVLMTAMIAASISIEFAIMRITRAPFRTSSCRASPATARPSSAYVSRLSSQITAVTSGAAATAAWSM